MLFSQVRLQSLKPYGFVLNSRYPVQTGFKRADRAFADKRQNRKESGFISSRGGLLIFLKFNKPKEFKD